MKNEFKNYERKILRKALDAFVEKMDCKYSDVGKYLVGKNEFEVIHEFLTYEEIFWLVVCTVIPKAFPKGTNKNDKNYWISKRTRNGFYFPIVPGCSLSSTDQKAIQLAKIDEELVWLGLAVHIHVEVESMAERIGSNLLRLQAKIQRERLVEYLDSLLE